MLNGSLYAEHVCYCDEPHVDFAQPLDWQAVRLQAKGVWKSTTMEDGEQFVTTTSATLTPESFAAIWDLGW